MGPPESEPAREAAASALDRVTRLCHRVLVDLLFQELQVSEAGGWRGEGYVCTRTGEHPANLQFLSAHDSVFRKQAGSRG